ncbi:MAG TPA: sulfotransferase domain-containing protein [Polyangiaceae bacterium]|nr:sulfotransferase domain-containing protein [Polyangiaceae bacterium]
MFDSNELRFRIVRALPRPVRVPVNGAWIELRRWLRLQRADVCFVSYPKAGRTWLRMLLGSVLQGHFGVRADSPMELESFADLDARIPRIFVTHDGVRFRSTPDELGRSKKKYAKKRVILLVRDPRDIVVSRYFHAAKRGAAPYQHSISRFMRGRRGGYATILEFHRIWAAQLSVPRQLLLVRYEDMIDDPARELRRVLEFLELDRVPPELVAAAVAAGSFNAMRQLEERDAFNSVRLRPIDSRDPDSFKVRRGKVGGYRDYMDELDLRFLDSQLAAADLRGFGY